MKIKPYLTVAVSYVGAVVGAGFISGQELAQFFIQFGLLGIFGWILIIVAVTYGGSHALQNFSQSKYESLANLMTNMFGEKLSKVANVVTLGYLVGGIVIMLSGAGTLLSNFLNIPLYVCVLFVTTCMYLVVIGKSKRLLNVNSILVPFLTIATLIVTVKTLASATLPNFGITFQINNPSALLPNWWISIVLYLGYNILGALVSFINIAKESTPKEGRIGGFMGGLMVGFLGCLLIASMWVTYPLWATSDLPAVEIVQQQLPALYIVFAPAMVFAMFTVATNYSLGIADYVAQRVTLNFKVLALLLLTSCGIVSMTGFSKLLGIIYPVFGILATLLGVWMFLQYLGIKLNTILKRFKPEKRLM